MRQNHGNNQLSQSHKRVFIFLCGVLSNALAIWIVIDYFIGYYHGIREEINDELPIDYDHLEQSYQRCFELFSSQNAQNIPHCATAASYLNTGDNGNQFSGSFPVTHTLSTDAVGSFVITTLVIWLLNFKIQAATTEDAINPNITDDESNKSLYFLTLISLTLYSVLPTLGALDGWAKRYASFDGCIQRCADVAEEYEMGMYDSTALYFEDNTYPSIFAFSSSIACGLTAAALLLITNVLYFWLDHQISLRSTINNHDPYHTAEQGGATTEATPLLPSTTNLRSAHDRERERERKEEFERLSADAPDHFKCPVTRALMRDPVILKTGHSYERKAIEQWLKSNNTNPLDGTQLTNKELIPNLSLRHAIEDYIKQQRAKAQSQLFASPNTDSDEGYQYLSAIFSCN